MEEIKKPLVSIIVPVYKAEKYIRKCLDSIITQTFVDWEAILVDDGSPDRCGKICDEYAKQDDRIKTFHIENSGVSSARNLGLRKSIGKYICFVDADDYLDVDYVSSLLAGFVNENVMLSVTGYYKTDDKGNILDDTNGRLQLLVNTDRFIEMVFENKNMYMGYPWAKLYCSDIIGNNNLWFNPDIYFNEDRLFLVSYIACLAHKGEGLITIKSKPSYYYVQNSGSAMNQLHRQFDERCLTDLEACELMKKQLYKFSCRKRLSAILRYNCMSQLFYLQGLAYKNNMLTDGLKRKFSHYYKENVSIMDFVPPFNPYSKILIKYWLKFILRRY